MVDLGLSSLNGTNGFKLDGENVDDFSGFAVNTAGDINSDGYTDLIIGAYGFAAIIKVVVMWCLVAPSVG